MKTAKVQDVNLVVCQMKPYFRNILINYYCLCLVLVSLTNILYMLKFVWPWWTPEKRQKTVRCCIILPTGLYKTYPIALFGNKSRLLFGNYKKLFQQILEHTIFMPRRMKVSSFPQLSFSFFKPTTDWTQWFYICSILINLQHFGF